MNPDLRDNSGIIDPFTYSVEAKYIPFAGLTKIIFDTLIVGGITNIHFNCEYDGTLRNGSKKIYFSEPPKRVRLVECTIPVIK